MFKILLALERKEKKEMPEPYTRPDHPDLLSFSSHPQRSLPVPAKSRRHTALLSSPLFTPQLIVT